MSPDWSKKLPWRGPPRVDAGAESNRRFLKRRAWLDQAVKAEWEASELQIAGAIDRIIAMITRI
jgi:hypothetical protein